MRNSKSSKNVKEKKEFLNEQYLEGNEYKNFFSSPKKYAKKLANDTMSKAKKQVWEEDSNKQDNK